MPKTSTLSVLTGNWQTRHLAGANPGSGVRFFEIPTSNTIFGQI